MASGGRCCPFTFCFFGVDVAGMSFADWIPPFTCMQNSSPFPLCIEERAAHWSCSPGSFSWSVLEAFLFSAAAAAVSTRCGSWSETTLHGEGVRRSSAVSQDVMECWLSLLYPPPPSSSTLLFRSRSAKARVTRSPLLLRSRKQLAESTTCAEGEPSAWSGPEPPWPANFSQKPEEDLRKWVSTNRLQRTTNFYTWLTILCRIKHPAGIISFIAGGEMCTSLRNVASFLSNLKQACNCLSGLHFNHVDVNSGLFQATLP